MNFPLSRRALGRAAAAILATALLAAPALAHEIKAGALVLTDLWTRATPPNAPTAAGYLTIANTGTEEDRLIAVTTPAATKAEIHLMATEDGVMTMTPSPDGVVIPAGETVVLAPGGYHLMFIGVTQPIVEGERLPVTLTFAKAGTIETFLHVLAIGAAGPDGTAPASHEGHGS